MIRREGRRATQRGGSTGGLVLPLGDKPTQYLWCLGKEKDQRKKLMKTAVVWLHKRRSRGHRPPQALREGTAAEPAHYFGPICRQHTETHGEQNHKERENFSFLRYFLYLVLNTNKVIVKNSQPNILTMSAWSLA